MDEEFIEYVRDMNLIGAWETYGMEAIAVVSQGTPGEYTDNPTVKEYEAMGYKLKDANIFGQGYETGEILIFSKSEWLVQSYYIVALQKGDIAFFI